MPNKHTTDGNYRYAFQGQEKDNETEMEAFELRLWDGRLGRWLTVDPAYAHFSPYLGMGNNPASEIDPDGGCPCSECPENCGGAGTNPTTDSDSMFPGTSGLQQLQEIVVTPERYNSNSSWTSEMVNGQYGYGGTLEQWIAEYGVEAYNNYSAEDALKWHKEVNLRLIKESNDAELMFKLSFFKNNFEAISTVVAPTQAINSFVGRGLPKSFSYNPRFSNPTPSVKVHGNSLNSTRPTWGYKLYSNDNTFLKNGITSKLKPESRYTKSFMSDKYMEKQLFPNRRSAYDWEFKQNQISKGPLNKNMH